MKIRLADLSDVSQLAQLRYDHKVIEEGAAEADSAENFEVTFGAFLKENLGANLDIWVGETDNHIVSTVYITKFNKVPKPTESLRKLAYISNVYTKPELRNKGLGKDLMEEAIAFYQESDVEMLLLWPSEKAKSFYNRLGFVPSSDALEMDV